MTIADIIKEYKFIKVFLDRFQIIDIDAKIVICTPNVQRKIASAVDIAKNFLKREIKFFTLGSFENLESDSADILKLLHRAEIENAPHPVVFSSEELHTKTAIVFWTSGTTGSQNKMIHDNFDTLVASRCSV